jgi:ATP-binding cassette subfamily B protein
LVAHRLSTIVKADKIFVLEDGRVVESGTHRELLAKGGAYEALWKVQTGDAA